MWQFSLFPSLKNRKTKKSSLLQVVQTTVGSSFASCPPRRSLTFFYTKKPIHRSESAFLYKVTKLIPILKYSAGPSELSIPKG